MQFSQLFEENVLVIGDSGGDVKITAPVTEDSRKVQPGGVFVARRGGNFDGHKYIKSALERGAAAIVGELAPHELDLPSNVPYVRVSNAQQAVGYLAACYYGHPSRNLIVAGVTGTDGKTTTSILLHNILKAAKYRAGLISTISAVIGDEEMPTGLHVTTPGAEEIQWYLRRMVDAGLTHCVIETTSHGLAQGRVNGVEYDVAVITNLTHEHLDEHGSFENYRAAKGILFEKLNQTFRKPNMSKFAIINRDDPNAGYYLNIPADYHLTYSVRNANAEFMGSAKYKPNSTQINVHIDLIHDAIPLTSSLIGEFNVYNILAATAAGIAMDCSPDAVQAGVDATKAVSGRMERIDEGQNFIAVVDFAHTPNALRRALEAARLMLDKGKRLIAVFGSAGLRDVEKRRLMAEVSTELADISVFTAEDPRTESLDDILDMMARAAVRKGGEEGRTFYREPDRGAAIAFACSLAQPGDLVIACGKGHEQSMAFGTTEYPWDDRDAMRAALRGSPLRTLPTAK
jgi:UDP-N-acetylmuramoyl-L-alanyl-D-glutamate--2,6-diaminopimelate ligase